MSVIVTDAGFAADDWPGPITAFAERDTHRGALAMGATDDPAPLHNILSALHLIRIDFAAFNDGRGLTLARRLREAGFAGRLRAAGPLLADQYAMLRRVGFDEVEIPDDLAARQPAAQWAFRADWRAHDYQSRLRA